MGVRIQLQDSDRAHFLNHEIQTLEAIFTQKYSVIEGVAEVRLVSAEEICALNKQYRALDEATDVLSFPTVESAALLQTWPHQGETPLGDIVICLEKAQAYNERLIDLVHHGLLHLIGFDHEKERVQWDGEEKALIDLASEQLLTLHPLGHDTV